VIDEDYFREWLGTLLSEFAELHDLERNTTELLVMVELVDGTTLLVIAWRAWADWIVLFTEDDGMHTVPYDRITKVSVLARPTPPPAAPPRPPFGFTTVDDEQVG
jgi:hypothetical protein